MTIFSEDQKVPVLCEICFDSITHLQPPLSRICGSFTDEMTFSNWLARLLNSKHMNVSYWLSGIECEFKMQSPKSSCSKLVCLKVQK